MSTLEDDVIAVIFYLSSLNILRMVFFSTKSNKIGLKNILSLSVGFWGSSSMSYLIPQSEAIS